MRWTKTKAMRWAELCDRLAGSGFDGVDVDALLKCERTLHRWAERECGDGSDWHIERDESNRIPYNVYHGQDAYTNNGTSERCEPRKHRIRDMETAALKRSEAIASGHGCTVYHQKDPRGCALYIIRPGDVPAGCDIMANYNRGIAVCID